jgi:hypothetical protein
MTIKDPRRNCMLMASVGKLEKVPFFTIKSKEASKLKNHTIMENMMVYKTGRLMIPLYVTASTPSKFNIIFPKGKNPKMCPKTAKG